MTNAINNATATNNGNGTVTDSNNGTATNNNGNGRVDQPTRDSQSFAASEAVQRIEQIESDFDLQVILDPNQRKSFDATIRRISPEFIEAVAAAASKGGGKILSVSFDPNAAREAVAYAVAMGPLASAARHLADRIDDRVRQALGTSASQALIAYQHLERSQRTPEGKALRESLADMREQKRVIKRAKSARRGTKPAAPPGTTQPAAPPATTQPAAPPATTQPAAPPATTQPAAGPATGATPPAATATPTLPANGTSHSS